MEAIILYTLKVAAGIALFYSFYRLLLSRETLHRLNRIVLIATAILSFILPFCVITIHKTVTLGKATEAAQSAAEGIGATGAAVTPWWQTALVILYATGTVAVLVHTAISLLSVVRLIRSGRLTHDDDGACIVVIDRDIAPCSWMRWAILSREDYEGGVREIREHEKAHIALGHSWDLLIVDVLTAFQWFNPMMWMLRADLRAIHEFEADDMVLSQGVNIKEYQYLLIKKAVSASGYSITNSFNHSTLKNRITMMSKSKSNSARGLRVLYAIPLLCLSLAAYAEVQVDYRIDDPPTTDNKGKHNMEKIVSADEIKIKRDNHIKVIRIEGSDDTSVKVKAMKATKFVTKDGKNLKDINPEDIESISVHKKDTEKKFGKDGKYGFIEVKLKGQEEPLVFFGQKTRKN